MMIQTFPDFEAGARALGFDEVLERQWGPNAETGTHTHPFSVQATVALGEMWLTVGQDTRHLRAGERFELDADTDHSERYGSEGATLWVARRQAGATS